MNKMGKIWQKFDKKSQFWIFFQYNHVLKPSQWIETSRFHMEMFWGFQKGIKHVSISNGCGVGSYNQGGLIIIFKTFWCVFYSRGSSIQGCLIIAEILYVRFNRLLNLNEHPQRIVLTLYWSFSILKPYQGICNIRNWQM